MAQTIESNTNSSDGSEDELIKELLDNESPLFLLPKSMESEPSISIGSVMNQLLSTIYSGPTIEDIKNALSTPYQHTKSEEHKTCRSTSLMSEKGLISKMQNKYSLKIKSGENTVAEDGYKWRKYGQKSIKNNPNPRSYYKCTDPRCSAKKQVERSTEDPDTLVVTYEGLHLHFTYSHFLPTINNIKRPRTHPPPKEAQPQETQKVDPKLQSPTMIMLQQGPPGEVASPSSNSTTPQGLLEDAMQLILRKPLDNHTPSGEPSSPRSSSSSSISW